MVNSHGSFKKPEPNFYVIRAQCEAVFCLTSCHHGHFRFKEGEVAASDPGQSLFCEEGKHVLCVPKVSDSDGRSEEAWAAKHHESLQAAGNSNRSDEWLVTEVFNIITADWHTWFGTLCVFLWLLYLILLWLVFKLKIHIFIHTYIYGCIKHLLHLAMLQINHQLFKY